MTDTKCILLCGPKLSGKDKAIQYMQQQGLPLVVRECKTHLHKLTQEFFLVSPERYWEIYHNRDLKELPLPEFQVTVTAACKLFYNVLKKKAGVVLQERGYADNGMVNLSVREAMILVAEIITKPVLGDDYYGRSMAASIQDNEIAIDSSTAFVCELPPIIERVGQDNILLIRIKGRGTFEGDSRNYIPNGVIFNTVDINNTRTEQEYLDNMYDVVSNFIGDSK